MGKTKKRKRTRSSSSSASRSPDCVNQRDRRKRYKQLKKELKRMRLHSRSRSPCRRTDRGRSVSRSPPRSTTRPTDKLIAQRDTRPCSREQTLYPQVTILERNVNTAAGSDSDAECISISPVRPKNTVRYPDEMNACSVYSPGQNETSEIPVNAGSVHENDDDALVIHNDVDLSDDLLKILGENPETNDSNAYVLHAALAPRWRHTLLNGTKKDELMNILAKYDVPSNLAALSPPKLNPEILSILPKSNLMTDGSHSEVQNSLGKGLCALGKGITFLLHNTEESISKESKETLLTLLSDSGRILTSLFHRVSVTRKNTIVPLLNKNIKDLVDKATPTEYLFGADFGEQVKAVKSLENLSKDLKLPSTPVQRQKRGGGNQRAPAIRSTYLLNSQRPARRSRETRPYRGLPSKTAQWNSHSNTRKNFTRRNN